MYTGLILSMMSIGSLCSSIVVTSAMNVTVKPGLALNLILIAQARLAIPVK
jgi:hypothetical protein